MRLKTNVQNICKFVPLVFIQPVNMIKKSLIFFCALLFFNCGNETVINNCFPNITINGVINLNNPEFINLQTPAGYTITNVQSRAIIIINGTSKFKAYDLSCPEKDCTTAMTFDGLKLKCVCSDKEYNSLNGSPIDAEGCFALEYNVTQTSSSTLQISR